jgi:hypothetical protein
MIKGASAMTMNWGPGTDAEITYRMNRAKGDFGRSIFNRKARAQRNSAPRVPIHRAAI